MEDWSPVYAATLLAAIYELDVEWVYSDRSTCRTVCETIGRSVDCYREIYPEKIRELILNPKTISRLSQRRIDEARYALKRAERMREHWRRRAER